MSRQAGNIETTALYRLLTQRRALQRTSKCVEERPVQKCAPTSGRPRQKDEDHDTATTPFSAFFSGQPNHGLCRPQSKIPLSEKSKLKTRNAASASIPEVDNIEQLSVCESFSQQGFRGSDTLQAMATMGFHVEKLYGSV